MAAVDTKGKGAITYALESGHSECVKALLGGCPLRLEDEQKPNKLITINADIDKVTTTTTTTTTTDHPMSMHNAYFTTTTTTTTSLFDHGY